MRARRWRLWLALAAATLVAGGLLGAVTVRKNIDRDRGCEGVRAEAERRGDENPVTTGGPVAVVLGDSWSAGSFLGDPRADAWSTRIGATQGWTTYVDAIGLTGYTNGGYCGGEQFAARVDRVLERDPDVVVILGGLNDDDAAPDEIRTAALRLLDDLAVVPDIYVVGPPDTEARENEERVDRVLAEVAAEANRPYVSTLSFDLSYQHDRLHLTRAGHEQFAAQVTAALPVAAGD